MTIPSWLDAAPTYDAARHPHAAMPLGGIGTGSVAIGADGGLRQWQLHNIGNHLGEAPGTFFALRVTQVEPPFDTVRILQAQSAAEPRPATPIVTDNVIPTWQRDLLNQCPGFAHATMRALYPLAEVTFRDPELPLRARLTALNPLAPLDPETSGIPAAMFALRLRNEGEFQLHGQFGAAIHNPVGGDGVVNPVGVAHPGYGGNTNRLRRGLGRGGDEADGWTQLIAENLSLPADDPRAGQLVLAVEGTDVAALPQWDEPGQFLRYLRTRPDWSNWPIAPAARRYGTQGLAAHAGTGPSPAGRTWCGGLAASWVLEPGEERTIRFVLAWHFPNRIVSFDHFGPKHSEYGTSRFWLGNEYAARYVDAEDVARDVIGRWQHLTEVTGAWCAALTDASLPGEVGARMATQAIPVRTPTSFRTGDGEFFGFEGLLGASTAMWNGDVGGSCPLNCTHVWNYEHALAYLFPAQEQSMRRTEFDVMQAPEGYIPHRVIVPTYLPQLWNVDIGGPEEPALDGMLGAILKTYREVRNGAGDEFRGRYYPHITRLLDHIAAKWDPKATGRLAGIQPSTHDIDLAGANTFMGTLYLAALLAAERLALLEGDPERAAWCRARFESGTARYDEICWDGEYYRQVLDPGDPTDFQWGPGCLSDQLIGQWWAHELDLGYVLPEDHVREALRAIVRYNLRTGFEGFEHPYRVYADGQDTGLLMCSWPKGGRPDVPTRYADEVWSGGEYQLAAHCLREGLVEEGEAVLAGLWARHDGTRRNPFNEIECGDHYARSMAGWTVLRAYTGIDYDAVTARLTIRPLQQAVGADGVARLPFVAAGAWGHVEICDGAAHLIVTRGELRVARATVQGAVTDLHEPVTVTPGAPLELKAGAAAPPVRDASPAGATEPVV